MPEDNKYKGIGYMCGATLSFALMSLFIKLSGNLPVFQKLFFRNFFSALVFAFLVFRKGQSVKVDADQIRVLIYRSISGSVAMLCYFYTVDNMNIADASALNKLTPFFAIIVSAVLLNERIKRADIVAIVIAFFGALCVVKPTLSFEFFYFFCGIFGALVTGIAYTLVRKAGKLGVKPNVIILFFSSFSCMFTLPFMLFSYVDMDRSQFIYILLSSVMAMLGQFFTTNAYSKAKARDIAVFDYMQVVYTAILGFFVLGELPDIYSFIGYAIIIMTAVVKAGIIN